MLRRKFWETPGIKLALVFFLGLFFVVEATKLATSSHRFGVTFTEGMTIESEKGKATLTARDLILEPGEITIHQELTNFYKRQNELAEIASANSIIVTGQSRPSFIPSKEIYTARSFSFTELPALFWIQVFVGFGSLIVSGWIWSLRSRDLASTLFAFSGVAMFMSAIPSAIYTTRELALGMPSFKILEELNALGAVGFGMSMLALFLVYPLKVKKWKWWSVGQCLFFGTWLILYFIQLTPESLGLSVIMLCEMLAICLAIGVQFLITKKDPHSRAILAWLGLSVLFGAGAFIAFNTVPLILETTPLNQGYAFTFFLIIYLGLAAGISKFRLFEVGQWAFRFLFYAMGALVLVLLDAVLIFLLGMNRLPALGVALLATGFLYLPLRDFLWNYFSKKRKIEQHELLAEALHVSFAATEVQRALRWMSLLKKLFDPLEIKALNEEIKKVALDPDGLTLIIPAVANSPALQLKYPWSGGSLYSTQSEKLAKELVAFIEKAESSREAYDRGVIEERRRMAQDLHDDVGARLLTGLYMADDNLRPTLQGAIADIRSIVSGMSGEKITVAKLLADLRYEASTRLASAQIELNWPIDDLSSPDTILDYREHKALSSAVREVVSNVIKHSEAGSLEVEVNCSIEELAITFTDDGKGIPREVLKGENYGHGLKNLMRRMHDIQGKLSLLVLERGTRVHFKIPLKQ